MTSGRQGAPWGNMAGVGFKTGDFVKEKMGGYRRTTRYSMCAFRFGEDTVVVVFRKHKQYTVHT